MIPTTGYMFGWPIASFNSLISRGFVSVSCIYMIGWTFCLWGVEQQQHFLELNKLRLIFGAVTRIINYSVCLYFIDYDSYWTKSIQACTSNTSIFDNLFLFNWNFVVVFSVSDAHAGPGYSQEAAFITSRDERA